MNVRMNKIFSWIFSCLLFLAAMQISAFANAPDIEFGFGDFDEISSEKISYYKNEMHTFSLLSPETTLVLNGSEADIADVFSGLFIYYRDGSIVVSDTNGDGKYDFISVSTPDVFVVESNSGSALTLKNGFGEETFSYDDVFPVVNRHGSPEGKPLSELKQNDVLEVFRNPFNASAKIELWFVDVVYKGMVVEVSTLFANTSCKLEFSDGSTISDDIYTMCGAYGIENLKIAYVVTVYIVNAFEGQKIAAIFYDIEDNYFLEYGVITNYEIEEDGGKNYGVVTLINNSGRICEYKLCDVVGILYPDSETTSFEGTDISEVEDRLVGNLLKFQSAVSIAIDHVEFPKTNANEKHLVRLNNPGGNYTYSASEKAFTGDGGSFAVDENTKVYFVSKTPNGNNYGIDEDWSGVGGIELLENGAYAGALLYDLNTGSGTAKIVTIFDHNPFGAIRFLGAGKDDRPGKGFYYTYDKSITVLLNPEYREEKLLIAAYRGNALIGLENVPIGQLRATINVEHGGVIADFIRAFIWENTEGMIPIIAQTLNRVLPSTDYSSRMAILEKSYSANNADGYGVEVLTYYQNELTHSYPTSPTTQYIGFSSDGKEGLESHLSLYNYRGSYLDIIVENGEIIQISLLAKANISASTITIGSNVNKTTVVSDKLTLYAGVVESVSGRKLTLSGDNGTITIPFDAATYYCYMKGQLRFEAGMGFSRGDIIDKPIVVREYDGVITDMLVIGQPD